jgi:isopenicillin-N epimerase
METHETAFWRSQWELAPGVAYLNHGSFGPPPRAVQLARRDWQAQLDRQPMEFFVRRHEDAWYQSRRRLARFVGADERNVVFAENATSAMNVVAQSLTLGPNDEILLTDHEYGAVARIWRRAAEQSASAEVRITKLPLPVESSQHIVDAIMAATDQRTRLLVISHITSPTAITLPVREIVTAARERGILTCIDGPHAVAQLPLDLEQLECDFYCASCHKWLCAPFGSGFLYVSPQHHDIVKPSLLSWGRLPPTERTVWSDEFVWSGTRDPSPYLAVPAAIDFLQQVGLERFRQTTHSLAQYARRRLVELVGMEPIVPDSREWYGNMAHVPLPLGDAADLQKRLWSGYGIEVPIIHWDDRRWIRVSCHLYNTRAEIDRLVDALHHLLYR